MIRGRVLGLALGWALAAGDLAGAEATPTLVQSVPGQFEIAAIDATAAHAVAAAAAECWRHLTVPLALPEAFSSAIFVRLIPAGSEDAGGEAFRVNVEPGGVVSVWLWGGTVPELTLRRALVHGLVSRLAVALHGVATPPTVPLWLEHACVGWWETHAQAASLDALKQRTARRTPPPIAGLLDWPRDGIERRGFADAATWLLTFLRSESGRADEWGTMLRRLLAGGDPQAALAAAYPGRFFGVPARELWWQTGWHHARRVRGLPVLDAAESRVLLGALARFVFAAEDGDADRLVPLSAVMARADEPLVGAEVARRNAELGRLITALHPFYRNAGLSLGELLGLTHRSAARVEAACAVFADDWRDAVELEEATRAALDALEASSAGPAVVPGTG